jgi:hypothetical protein
MAASKTSVATRSTAENPPRHFPEMGLDLRMNGFAPDGITETKRRARPRAKSAATTRG